MNVTRQGGKSAVAALLALHEALTVPGALILLVSPSLRQSIELFKKVVSFYHELGQPVPADAESILRLELSNGSRLVALPSKEGTIRGYSSVRLLIFDEASRAEDSVYLALRPVLAVSQGRIVLLSTPWGKRGFFYDTWVNGGPEWQRVEVKATDCPRISQHFLEQERETLGDYWYQQEYCCVFGNNEASLFSWDIIQRSLVDFDELDLDVNLDLVHVNSTAAEIDFELDLD